MSTWTTLQVGSCGLVVVMGLAEAARYFDADLLSVVRLGRQTATSLVVNTVSNTGDAIALKARETEEYQRAQDEIRKKVEQEAAEQEWRQQQLAAARAQTESAAAEKEFRQLQIEQARKTAEAAAEREFTQLRLKAARSKPEKKQASAQLPEKVPAHLETKNDDGSKVGILPPTSDVAPKSYLQGPPAVALAIPHTVEIKPPVVSSAPAVLKGSCNCGCNARYQTPSSVRTITWSTGSNSRKARVCTPVLPCLRPRR